MARAPVFRSSRGRSPPEDPCVPSRVHKYPNTPAASTMIGKRHAQQENGDEGQHRDGGRDRATQRPPRDPQNRLDDQRNDRRFQSQEQTGDQRVIAPQRVHQTERHDGEESGSTNSHARHEPAARAVHEPADVRGELLRLRAGQQHAEVQGVQEALFADPALFLDEDPVHHRNLARGPAEAEKGDAAPRPRGLPEGHVGRPCTLLAKTRRVVQKLTPLCLPRPG